MGAPQDVVFTFSTETWEDARRREFCRPPDRVLLALQASDRVRRLLVADPWRHAGTRLLRSRRATFQQTTDSALVRPVRLGRQDPTTVPALVRSYRRYDEWLSRAAQQLGVTRPSVVTFNPFVAAFAPLAWASRVTYYARDDWAAFSPRRAWWPAYEAAYGAIRRRGHGVIAVSQPLLKRIAPRGVAVVVPNGVDPRLWRSPGQIPAMVEGLPRPLLVYAGTIDDRLDEDAVVEAAQASAGGSVVLIGPVADAAVAARLGGRADVHLTGPMSQAELVATVCASDVCLLPHRRTNLTEAMSPLKLFEYLASGRPVVATDLPPVREVGGGVRLVAGSADFGPAVREALAKPSLPEHVRRQVVDDHSWDARMQMVLDVVLGGCAE